MRRELVLRQPFMVTPDEAVAHEARQSALFQTGRRFAPIFHAFVRSVIERAQANGHERIYYLTREGEFFSAIHRRIADAASTRLPEPRLLEVSRRSTFAASLSDVHPQSLMRLWTLYSTQSLRGLLASLNVRADNYQDAAARHRLTLDEPVRHPWADARIDGFLADPSVRESLAASGATQRRLLVRYCEEREFVSGGRVALVDIGWRGTIQDNLAHVFPGLQIDGHYLGLLRFLNPQPPNVTKQAFGPDENQPDERLAHLLRFVTPYEMLTNSPSGSVIGYADVDAPAADRRDHARGTACGTPGLRDRERGPAYGGVQAVRAHHGGEDVVHQRYTGFFQQGVLDAVPALESNGVDDSRRRRDVALHLWHELAFEPPRALGRAYVDLEHDETFGLGSTVTKRSPRPTRLIARAFFSAPARRQLEAWLADTTWPAGILSAHGLATVAKLSLRRRSLAPPPGQFDQLLQQRAGRRRWARLTRELRGLRVCCYGAGEFAAAVCRHRNLSAVHVVGFVDRDPSKSGQHLGGYPVVGPEMLGTLQPDVVLMTVFRNPAVVESVRALVRDAGLTCQVRADIWE